jgi:myo-inositol-1(or 4)-monophosphatase
MPDAMARSALLNVMVQAAFKAGRGLARDFGEVENLQVSLKGPGDFVSAADHRADEILIAELRKARPGFSILTEESGTLPGADGSHRWIVDPLDGTTNFLHGIPLFAISIGLERDGKMVAGVIYNPILNELYVAESGTGAFLNDRRIRVAGRRHLADALIATGSSPRASDVAGFQSELKTVMAGSTGFRCSGSAAIDLAWVASGRFDGYWHHDLSPWDLAAGVVLISEAGGLVTDANDRGEMLATGGIVAGNAAIHGELLKSLRSVHARK